MSSLHAIKREHQNARIVQAKAVMPLIGPLLDAWEGIPNDAKGALRENEPALCDCLDRINAAMEAGIPAEEG